MNGKGTAVAALAAAAIAVPAAAGAVQFNGPHNTPKPPQGSATITLSQARAKAVSTVPGTIQSAELERENGKLRYSFDIKAANGGRREVGVDANTGEVVENRAEPAQAEHREQQNKVTTQPPY